MENASLKLEVLNRKYYSVQSLLSPHEGIVVRHSTFQEGGVKN